MMLVPTFVLESAVNTPMLNEDHILINGLKHGNQAAFEALYDKYAGKIYNYTAQMLRDKTLAEDLTQMCFMTLWERREYIDLDQSFVAYIYTIARNTVYKESRRLMAQGRYVDEITPPLQSQVDHSEYIIDHIDHQIVDGEFKKQIASLPEGRRRVVELRVMHHLSNTQIAEELNISVKTVEAQITTAMKSLQPHMEAFRK